MSVIQLLTDLPFNPSSAHRLADYRGRLKKDTWWRQLGLILLVSTLLIFVVADAALPTIWMVSGCLAFGLITLVSLGLWLRSRLLLKEVKIISHE